jgi:L-asparaginase
MKQPSVLIIYTGGTIGMVEDPASGSLMPFNFDQLSAAIPELNKINCRLTTISFDEPIDSSNMNIAVWQKMAKIIESNYSTYDGFVILHGSDTMAYTASALSFMLEGLNKAVILTGAQLPIGTIRTDGKENLITAIEIAGSLKNGKSVVPEVAIYFEYKLYRGNRTKKVDAEDFEAFQSLNYSVLAEAGVSIRYHRNYIRKGNESPLQVHYEMDHSLLVLKLFPGINETTVQHLLKTPNLKAVVMETYGSGNAPTESWFLNAVKEAVKQDLLIVNITQCNGGTVKQGMYATSLELEKAGVISGGDMTTEAAVTKLMYLLGTQKNTSEIRKLVGQNLRGEISVAEGS